MDKLCCSNSFKERRSIYCYKNSLFRLFHTHLTARIEILSCLIEESGCKGKTFFRNNQLFSKLFFRKPFGFQKNRTSRTSANHRQSTLICGGKDTPFFTNIPNFFGGIFKTFLHIEQSCYYSARYKTSFQSSIYNIHRCTCNPHPTTLRELCTPSGRPAANHPEERAAFAEKKSPHGPSRVPCGVRFGCAVSISRRSVRRLFASRSHSTTP